MSIRFRNHVEGYGLVTKALHWLTVLALAAQFTIGYAMTRADDLLEAPVDRWLRGDEERLLVVHAALGLLILVLAGVRLLWRRFTPLPPWAPGLSTTEQRLAHRVEQALYLSLLLVPLTGLALLLASGEDWDIEMRREWESPWEILSDDLLLSLHVVTHLVFFAALSLHVGLVLKHQVLDRDRLFRRML